MNTNLPILLIDLMKSAFGFGIAAAPVAALALRKRGQQNHRLAERLAGEVKQIRAMVNSLTDTLEKSQALVAIHTDKLNDTNSRIAQLTVKIDEIEEILPQIHGAMVSVESFFERAKLAASALKEKPLGEGMTALKPTKEGK